MASTLPRQPFAPLDGSRLQTLTSLKNRQNAFTPSAGKRKADSIDTDDSENVDPIIFSKRSKGADSFFSNDNFKPSSFVLTKAAAPSLSKAASKPVLSTTRAKPTSLSRPRSIIQPKSPVAKLNTSVVSVTPLSAPAGRSPTRGSKRIGILSKNRRRTASPFTRVDPPAFSGLGGAAPFSLDAAIKGTVSSYASRSAAAAAPVASSSLSGLYGAELDGSWIFDIHEDTPEQEMTNLLQHSTCVLDISSDEESEQKRRRETAEGRDKENIPPADDVSQTASFSARRRDVDGDDMVFEKQRGPLAEMNVADFYADGCDSSSVIIVPGDDEAETVHGGDDYQELEPNLDGEAQCDFEPEPSVPVQHASIDELMGKRDEPAPQAALLQPIEGTGESFELWESSSAKDEAEPIAPSTPSPATEEEPAPVVDTEVAEPASS